MNYNNEIKNKKNKPSVDPLVVITIIVWCLAILEIIRTINVLFL